MTEQLLFSIAFFQLAKLADTTAVMVLWTIIGGSFLTSAGLEALGWV